ncbi:MAG: hypothetical protein ABI778_00150 [Ignavibacteriota bacterium]
MFLKVLASFLLLMNGVGAVYGGWMLISHPDGSGFGMPLSILQYSPFTDFFIPGIILFIVNGLGSLLVFVLLFRRVRKYEWYVIGEGAILTGWIFIQVILIRGVGAPHFIFGAIGLLLIITGWLLGRKELVISN